MSGGPFPAGGTPRAAGRSAPCTACGGTDFAPRFRKYGWAVARCGGCGLLRVDPLPEPGILAEIYERSYRDGLYATFAQAADVRAATARARVAALRARVPPGPWLDVGCSTGALLEAAGAAGLEAEGFEQSAAAVAVARARGLAVTHATAETFAPARAYACVTTFDLLEHLLDPGAFLARARGWLAPGGRLALTVPDVRSITARLMRRHWPYYAPPLHVHYFDRYTLGRLLARHGFRVLTVGPAPKRLTLDYVAVMLPAFNPRLGAPLAALVRLAPRALRTRPLPVPVGELLVVAAAEP